MVAHRSAQRIVLEDGVPPPWVGQCMTLDEFLALPDAKPHLEFTDGLVTQKMAAKPTHSHLTRVLLERFNQLAGPRRLGIASPELRFVTLGWAPVPDVSYYRRERPRAARGKFPGDYHEPPDISVEIVSPEQGVTELLKKCLRYIALGTQVALLIDPDPETVAVFRAGQPLQLLQGDDRIDLDDVLPGFEMTVGEMFDALVPSWVSDDNPEDAGTES